MNDKPNHVGPEGKQERTSAEDTFTRRVCAVLLVDVTGFSALMDHNDERSAHAVQELRAAVQDLVVAARGQAEPVAGDAIFATFDSMASAVETGLAILRRTAQQTFAGLRLKVRIGAHLGDVLKSREGAAFGDAINVAARLQQLAAPGTLCISSSAFRQIHQPLDASVVDLGYQRLKNISYRLHAYLIAPREHAEALPRSRQSRRRNWGAAAVLLAVLAGVVLFGLRDEIRDWVDRVRQSQSTPTAPGVTQLSLGVMQFGSQHMPPGDVWIVDALRDGLNARLSKLSRVKVYSKEYIDFLKERQKLSDVEIAGTLGITKMLLGQVVARAGDIAIDIRVIDVKSGALDETYTATGRQDQLLELQNELLRKVIGMLKLRLEPDEEREILASKNTDLEAWRLILEAEGGGHAAPGPSGTPSSEPRSSLPHGIDVLALLRPAAAAASEEPAEERGRIMDVLERYRRAIEQQEITALADLYTEFTPDQRTAQERYFANVRDLHIAIEYVDIAIVREEAVVSYTRTDDFVDARTGRPIHVAVRLTKVLRHEQGNWKLVPGK